MKTRSDSNGKSLIAQGEPMVWLAGGMFAIACAMIASLLGLILFQGLSTLWPKPYVVFPLEDGGFVGGEWIANQPYSISKDSIDDFPEPARKKASQLLGDRSVLVSEQVYLRTGNFDVGNKHFTYVPSVFLTAERPAIPKDIWLVERLEWGVLFGFPIRIERNVAPEMDPVFSKKQLLLQQIDRFRPEDVADQRKFDDVLTQMMEMAERSSGTSNHTLTNDVEQSFVATEPNEIQRQLSLSESRMRRVQSELDHLKDQLGELDGRLARARINVRKAELRDKTDLLSSLDDGIELATSLGAIEQQWRDFDDSLALWMAQADGESTVQLGLKRIAERAQVEMQQEIKPIAEALQEWKNTSIVSLPLQSKNAVEEAIRLAQQTSASQASINAEISRLESVRSSEQLTFALPISDGSALDGITEGDGFVKQSQSDGSIRYGWRPSDGSAAQAFTEKTILVADIVRWFQPNQLSLIGKARVYFSRWFEFLFGFPREAGVEGGFFPAIWGTVVMTLLMSLAVMPFGVMAALYMREYAKSGWILSLIRISINNLAGVPSIVYGVFGLAFFCYTIGGYVDGGPIKAGFTPWPTTTWFLACALTVLIGTVAFALAFLCSGSPTQQSAFVKRLSSISGLCWLFCLLGFVVLLIKTPFFEGFYQSSLPNPTFGKGCLLWASMTLALLTLPVVIVATEEALAAVPNSLREGSYACGAGKWQTLQRIVLPYARPGIITGFILAMARGAGEVAPMMLVGAIPLAMELPLDREFPFFHGSRSFMHLGFQIFSLGFQSQNSEAAKPMVFTATLLLLTIVTLLNVAAIWLRARLRKRFQSSQF
jgi:phosphate transport system permease protein